MMAATLRQIGAAMTNVKSTRSIADRICGEQNAPRGDLFHRPGAKNGKELLRRSNAGSDRPRRVSILLAGDALNVGEIEMNADPKRKSDRGPYHPDERVRRHQEEALDDAFKHTFPA